MRLFLPRLHLGLNSKNECLFIISSRVFDNREALLDAAVSLASVIARKSPIAVQGSKINLNYARDHTVDDNFTFVVCFELELSCFNKSIIYCLHSVRGIVLCY